MIKIAIIGSGPGAAVVCRELSKYDVYLEVFEAGPNIDQSEVAPFSTEEIDQKYEGSGTTAIWGNKIINYGAAKCFGGGSEINAGLYYRTPKIKIDFWANKFKKNIKDVFNSKSFQDFENLMSVSYSPNYAPKASKRFIQGAKTLGLKAIEVPRWVKYTKSSKGFSSFRQSMQEVVWKKLSGKIKINTNCSVKKIIKNVDSVTIKVESQKGTTEFSFDYLFICAGAIHTPYLLMRSGLIKNRFSTPLSFHPTVKVIAKFDQSMKDEYFKVPSHQIKIKGRNIGIGVSITNPMLIRLSMVGAGFSSKEIKNENGKYGLYYCMTESDSGRVLNIPGLKEPLPVHYLNREKKQALADGVNILKSILYNAGATEVRLVGNKNILRKEHCYDFKQINKSEMMTIHLMSSCPIWNKKSPISDSGSVEGSKRIFIADSSLIPDALGVNPQGTVMILSKHIVEKFIKKNIS